MTIILSQLNAVPSEFFLHSAIVALVFLGVVVALVTVWSNVRQRPPHETPTRREFDDLKTKVTHIEQTLPDMERRILAAVQGSGKDLSQKIDNLATVDHEERAKIWETFNEENKEIGERVARLESAKKP